MTGKLIGIARATKVFADMEPLDAVNVTKEAGLDGDRRGRTEDRQVTVLAIETWQAACADAGAGDLPWTARRANLLVDGVDLPREIGARLRIGGVLLEIKMEVDPCSRMEKAHAGLREALVPDWRGGVACTVIEEGLLTLGDSVHVE